MSFLVIDLKQGIPHSVSGITILPYCRGPGGLSLTKAPQRSLLVNPTLTYCKFRLFTNYELVIAPTILTTVCRMIPTHHTTCAHILVHTYSTLLQNTKLSGSSLTWYPCVPYLRSLIPDGRWTDVIPNPWLSIRRTTDGRSTYPLCTYNIPWHVRTIYFCLLFSESRGFGPQPGCTARTAYLPKVTGSNPDRDAPKRAFPNTLLCTMGGMSLLCWADP